MPESPTAQSPSPIADLTYRTYDGPLYTRRARWWIIAVARLRYLRGRWWFWLLVALSLMPYFISALILYFSSAAPTGPGAPPNPFMDNTPGQKFAFQFFNSLNWQFFWLFLLALAVGAGSIAADNRANALLVYLSKPLTKGDYLIGKWMSVFLTLFTVALAPALIFYLYCLMSYTSDGFLKNEPWLILRIVAACMVPAAIHASLVVGFSAWSKTPLLAGVTYAGIYFCSGIASGIVWLIQTNGKIQEGVLTRHLSLSGVMQGLNQSIFGVVLHVGQFARRRRQVTGFQQFELHAPDFTTLLLIGLALCMLGIIAARMRIRAVEVVQG